MDRYTANRNTLTLSPGRWRVRDLPAEPDYHPNLKRIAIGESVTFTDTPTFSIGPAERDAHRDSYTYAVAIGFCQRHQARTITFTRTR